MKGYFHHHHCKKSIFRYCNHWLSAPVFGRALTNVEILVLTLILPDADN